MPNTARFQLGELFFNRIYARLIKYLLLLTLSICSLKTFCQYDGFTPNSSPVTPNVASMFKATERPIGTFTGTTPIEIPLYTITAGPISIPISINYNNGGIKVEEIAGNVGLGWNLSANWSVSRNMRGLPDDYTSGYLRSVSKPSIFPSYNPNSQILYPSADSVLKNRLDVEPDIFYYSFNSHSGKFYFDENNHVVQVVQTGITIEPIWQTIAQEGAHIRGWIITDESGIRYYFGLNEAQNVSYIDFSNNSYTSTIGATNTPPNSVCSSSWHIAEIRDMNDIALATFNYSTTVFQFTTRGGAYMPVIKGGGSIDCTTKDSYVDEILVTNNATEMILTSIQSRSDSAVFYSSSNRMDLGGAELDSIRIYDHYSHLREKIHFNFDYFISSGATSLDQYRKRLKLKNVSYVVPNGTDSIFYAFDYVESVNLPSRMSRAVDYWGYFNGKDLNSTLLPNGIYTAYGLTVRRDDLADRRAYPSFSLANTLKKITYPTGGYREFEYEGNQALISLLDYQEQPDISLYQPRDISTITFNTTSSSVPAYQQSFTINSAEGSSVFNFSADGDGSFGTFYVKIIKIIAPGNESLVNTFENEYTDNWNLPNGNYRIEFYFDHLCTFFSFEGAWTELDINSSVDDYSGFNKNNINVGGIRVKAINDYDPVSGKTNSTQYKYYELSDTTTTSGLLITPIIVAEAVGCDLNSCKYLRLSASSCYPLISEGGAYCVYREVRTYQQDNGRIDATFSFDFDGDPIGGLTDFPAAPSDDNSWKRGKLIMEKIFSEDGSLKEKTITHYPFLTDINPVDWDYDFSINDDPSFGMDQQQIGWKVVGTYSEGDPAPAIKSACYNSYLTFSHFSAPTLKIESMYTPSGKQDIRTDYSYYNYGNILRPVLKQESVYLNGKIRQTNYNYAFNDARDFIFGLTSRENSIKDSLISKNYLRPLETTVKVIKDGDSVLLAGSKDIFAYYGLAGLCLSSSKKFPTLVDSIAINYSAYDSIGNLAEEYKANDMKISYLWEYNNTKPIAQVKNASLTQIAYTSFESDGSGNWTIGSSLRYAHGITGNRCYELSNGNITKSGLNSGVIYILSYWSQNSSSLSVSGAIGSPIIGKTLLIDGISWTYHEYKVTGQTTVTLSGNGFLDELRLYPANAQITTYTYDPLIGITSQCDIGNRITYYEYDAFNRLRRIRDQDQNIIKSFDYAYQASSGCGPNCYSIPAQTTRGTTMLGYPVGVFNVHRKLLGNATGPVQFVSLWNTDTADARIGTLSTGTDSVHFNITLNAGMTMPAAVIGLRYYQVDLPWNQFDAVQNMNASYVDFGDGTGMWLPENPADTATYLPPNTTYGVLYVGEVLSNSLYYVHNYPDTTTKIVTFYHSDSAMNDHLDNLHNPATSLLKIKNLRGNLPCNLQIFGSSSYQQASMNTVANISNWSSLHSIELIDFNNGDAVNPGRNMAYAQDFMQYNKGLTGIWTSLGYYRNGFRDTTFKLSRLKSDWNTYFTELDFLIINDDHWNREDLSGLKHLATVKVVATTQNHQDDASSPLIPLPSTVIDNILNQVAAGAGQSVNNGVIGLYTGGTTRTSSSDAALQFLKSRGWTITFNDVVQ